MNQFQIAYKNKSKSVIPEQATRLALTIITNNIY